MRNDFVRVLRIAGEFALAKAAQVGGRARAGVVEELSLRHGINSAVQQPHQVLKRWVLIQGRSCSNGWNSEVGKNGGVRDGAPRKIVGAVGVDTAIFAAGLDRVAAEHPGNVVACRVGSCVARRAAGVTKKNAAKSGKIAG